MDLLIKLLWSIIDKANRLIEGRCHLPQVTQQQLSSRSCTNNEHFIQRDWGNPMFF